MCPNEFGPVNPATSLFSLHLGEAGQELGDPILEIGATYIYQCLDGNKPLGLCGHLH